MNDQSLTDTADAADQAASPTTPSALATAALASAVGLSEAAVDTLLSFDELMSSAKRVRRIARICLRADLTGRRDVLLEELSGLVDPEGNIVSEGDQALADQGRANALLAALLQVDAEMQQSTRRIEFEAMPEDEWETFEKANRNASGEAKNGAEYKRKLIARCAIEPTLTEQQVQEMQSRLGVSQIDEMFNKAYEANRIGGIDTPKLPGFLLDQKPA